MWGSSDVHKSSQALTGVLKICKRRIKKVQFEVFLRMKALIHLLVVNINNIALRDMLNHHATTADAAFFEAFAAKSHEPADSYKDWVGLEIGKSG